MNERHVREILESAPFDSLGEGELATVRAHAAACDECRRAFDAARVSSLLLRERAGVVVEPSPFFQTRVLAALRERRAAEDVWSFARLWKSAGALVATMAAAVALMAGLTFVAPGSQSSVEDGSQLASASNIYSFDDSSSADDSIIAGDDAGDAVSDSQVLSTIYVPQDEEAK